MKQELEDLRTSLHKMVDEKINALVKPEKKLNVWYKSANGALHLITKHLTKDQSGESYGFNYSGNWFKDPFLVMSKEEYCEATPEEVLEALTKEAVKRFDGKKFTDARGRGNVYKFQKNSTQFNWNKDGSFCMEDEGNGTLMLNGIWATPIKEPKTIDEWADEYQKYFDETFESSRYLFKTFITENNFKLPE